MILSWVLKIFLGLYLIALLVWLVGTFGLFGVEKDPISGVFLLLLGQPWTSLVDYFPEKIWPLITAVTPAINAGILYALIKVFR